MRSECAMQSPWAKTNPASNEFGSREYRGLKARVKTCRALIAIVCLVAGAVAAQHPLAAQVSDGVRNASQYCANPGVLDETCISRALASDVTVRVPGGTYNISRGVLISGLKNLSLEFSPGAVLRANGMAAGSALVRIADSDSISVRGGQFDGNSGNAAYCVDIRSSGTVIHRNFKVVGIECRGISGYGIALHSTDSHAAYNLEGALVRENYLHDFVSTGTSVRGIVFNAVNDAVAELNRLDKANNGGPAILMSGTNIKVVQNHITGYPDAQDTSGIKSYGGGNQEVGFNTIEGPQTFASATYGVWTDAAENVSVVGNIVVGNYYGVVCEISPNCVISNNVFQYNRSAIYAEGRLDRVTHNSLDSTAGLRFGANVTGSTDTSDKQQGRGSLKLDIGSGFTGGVLVSQDLGTDTDWGGWPSLWIKPSGWLNEDMLSFQLLGADGRIISSQNIPSLYRTRWTQVKLTEPRFYPQTTAVRKWQIVANRAPGMTTLHLDDIGKDVHCIELRDNEQHDLALS